MSYNPSIILSILQEIQNYCNPPLCGGCPLFPIFQIGCDQCPFIDLKRNSFWLIERLKKEIPEQILEEAKVNYKLGQDTSEKDICNER